MFEAAGVPHCAAYQVRESRRAPLALVLHVSNFVPLVVVGALTLRYAASHPAKAARSATYT